MRSLPRVAMLSTVVLAVASSLAAVPTAAFAAVEVAAFTFTGATRVFTVPAGVTSVVITAKGGHGGRSPFDDTFGGVGGSAKGTFTVTPGEVLTVTVGGDAGSQGNNCSGYIATSCGGYGAGRGADSQYGGGGGGASAVATADGALLLVAGGGGGSGAGDYCPDGNRSTPGSGGPAGDAGGTAQPCSGSGYSLNGGGGGVAGTADAAGGGGMAGTGTATDSTCRVSDGSAGDAASGADGGASYLGGGGGGGWRGGGGGGEGARQVGACAGFGNAGAGGGGGGSSRVAPTAINLTVGNSDRAMGANGQVVISWDTSDNSPPVITSVDHVSFTLGTAGSFTVTTTPGYPTATALTVNGSLPSGVTFTDMGDGTATLAGTSAAGTTGSYPLTITATNSAGSTDQAFTLTVGAAAQTITFATLADKTYGAAPFTLSATATSGLPVTFTSDTATVCTITGSTITLHAAGSCIVVASQAGNSDWQPAAPVARSFTVGYVISGLAPPNKSVFKSGSRIPVKFQLVGADGTRIPDSVAAGLGCTVQVAFNTATPVCATYNATSDQFQANLITTGTRSGSTSTITITVTAGTTIVATSTVTVTAK